MIMRHEQVGLIDRDERGDPMRNLDYVLCAPRMAVHGRDMLSAHLRRSAPNSPESHCARPISGVVEKLDWRVAPDRSQP